jgi:hypothetical protein
MSTRSHVAKKNGVHYTPSPLADLLVKGVLEKSDRYVLDPSCGEGALLKAAENRYRALCPRNKAPLHLVGCDKLKHTGFPQGNSGHQFAKNDFFAFTPERKFDTVLMNPPFLARCKIPIRSRTARLRQYAEMCDLSASADLWAYFLLKAVGHLKDGGCIGAILPWSFLQAEYAANLRRWLSARFRSIKVLVLTGDHFKSTNKRVLLVWLRGYGEKSQSIGICCTANVRARHRYRRLSEETWSRSPVLLADQAAVGKTIEGCRKHGFTTLGDSASVRIGVVTDANGFFVLRRGEARRYLSRRHLVPILTTGEDLSGLTITKSPADLCLLKFPVNLPKQCLAYIAKGRTLEYHLRSHSRRRTPWYVVDVGATPDAFFHYRVTWIPYMVLNRGKLQSTNSIHRIYFDGMSQEDMKWVQVSLLSVPGQLGIEANARVYGNGILKLEPSGLKRAIIFVGKKPVPKTSYRRISQLLAQGEKAEAVAVATELIRRSSGISSSLLRGAVGTLHVLRSQRLG